MQTFNLSTLSTNKLDKIASKILDLKSIIFQHAKRVLKIDENYLFVLPNWLLIIITVLGTIVLV